MSRAHWFILTCVIVWSLSMALAWAISRIGPTLRGIVFDDDEELL